jgi:hypothetical protein
MALNLPGKDNKHRVQLDFSDEAFEELEALQRNLGATSRAEVVRDALGILRWAVHHLREGNAIIVERKDGERVEVEFPFFAIRK